MHELAICQALISQVTELADDRNAASVSDIFVSIGPLSGVESALLLNAFPIAVAGTCADGAPLHLEELPVKVHCAGCDVESVVEVNRLLCGQCGGWQTRLISGDELLLERVVLEPGEYERPPLETTANEAGLEG